MLEYLSLKAPRRVEKKNDVRGGGWPRIVGKLILQRGGQTHSVPGGRSLEAKAILSAGLQHRLGLTPRLPRRANGTPSYSLGSVAAFLM